MGRARQRERAMKQMTLAATKGFDVHGRATRKAAFLARMEAPLACGEFCAVIEPHYAKVGNGRPPIGVAQHAAHVLCRQLVQPSGQNLLLRGSGDLTGNGKTYLRKK